MFRLSTLSCEPITSLNAPSANSCAVAFNGNYILNIGGILNRVDSNNLIEMYNIVNAVTILARMSGQLSI